tara:strand:+ start:570 stop:917 length:348 start_codon:yes stop_codon:yes gene_type:complete
MTQQYDKPRSALFTNRNKTEENHPDYRGDMELDRATVEHMMRQLDNGAKFAKAEISGWKRQGQNAGPYLSLSIKPPYEKPNQNGAPQQNNQNSAGAENRPKPMPTSGNNGDTIPF